jgi:motility quorum-sensing regulator/GCU-specific mRNA interferase toxin
MEKRTPHCKLSVVKALIEAGKVRATWSAVAGAAALGFDFEAMVGLVRGLKTADFYKSMTAVHDRRIGQDGYRTATPAGEVYLKLTVIDDVLIVSFKEL